MGKLRALSRQKVCRILELRGLVKARQRGSHIIMQHMSDEVTTTIPVPDHVELRSGAKRYGAEPFAVGPDAPMPRESPDGDQAAAARRRELPSPSVQRGHGRARPYLH